MRRVICGLLALAGAITCGAQEKAAFELNDRGLDAASHGDHVKAEKLYRQALEEWRQLGPQYEAHLATTQSNLAQAICAQGRRRAGVGVFEESLTHFRHSLGDKHLRTLNDMNLLGGIYLMLGEFERAEPLLREALGIERELYSHDIQLARSLGGLASMKNMQGKIEEAMPLAEEALSTALAIEGENSLDAALAYSNVAEIHRVAGRFDRAYPLFRKARVTYESLLGPAHPRVSSMLSEEGLVLMNDGKLALAEQSMLRSLEILDRSCPGCVFERWVAETNLGMLRLKQHKYDEADRLLTSGLALQQKESLHAGPDVAATLQTLAEVREKQRRYDDAARLHRSANLILSYQN